MRCATELSWGRCPTCTGRRAAAQPPGHHSGPEGVSLGTTSQIHLLVCRRQEQRLGSRTAAVQGHPVHTDFHLLVPEPLEVPGLPGPCGRLQGQGRDVYRARVTCLSPGCFTLLPTTNRHMSRGLPPPGVGTLTGSDLPHYFLPASHHGPGPPDTHSSWRMAGHGGVGTGTERGRRRSGELCGQRAP